MSLYFNFDMIDGLVNNLTVVSEKSRLGFAHRVMKGFKAISFNVEASETIGIIHTAESFGMSQQLRAVSYGEELYYGLTGYEMKIIGYVDRCFIELDYLARALHSNKVKTLSISYLTMLMLNVILNKKSLMRTFVVEKPAVQSLLFDIEHESETIIKPQTKTVKLKDFIEGELLNHLDLKEIVIPIKDEYAFCDGVDVVTCDLPIEVSDEFVKDNQIPLYKVIEYLSKNPIEGDYALTALMIETMI